MVFCYTKKYLKATPHMAGSGISQKGERTHGDSVPKCTEQLGFEITRNGRWREWKLSTVFVHWHADERMLLLVLARKCDGVSAQGPNVRVKRILVFPRQLRHVEAEIRRPAGGDSEGRHCILGRLVVCWL